MVSRGWDVKNLRAVGKKTKKKKDEKSENVSELMVTIDQFISVINWSL